MIFFRCAAVLALFAGAAVADYLEWPAGVKSIPFTKPCHALAGKSILFVGDSFERHAYVAFVLWLSNNTNTGALKPQHDTKCEGNGQFEEKVCRNQLAFQRHVCGVSIALKYGAWPRPSVADLRQYDHIIWGGGNHPVDGDYVKRKGVNDAQTVNNLILRPTCAGDFRRWSQKIIWLQPHRQLDPHYGLQCRAQVGRYNTEMPNFLLKTCGIDKIVSVWNATDSLVGHHKREASYMTWDGMHWGMRVNMLKAYKVFDAMRTAESYSQAVAAYVTTTDVRFLLEKGPDIVDHATGEAPEHDAPRYVLHSWTNCE